jgi:hypothetical protein
MDWTIPSSQYYLKIKIPRLRKKKILRTYSLILKFLSSRIERIERISSRVFNRVV